MSVWTFGCLNFFLRRLCVINNYLKHNKQKFNHHVISDQTSASKLENMPLNAIMSLGYNSIHQMVAANQLLNPIDKLYSMQNQYFKSDDQLNQQPLNENNM